MKNQEIYINEIAEKLWSGHAAAMVGTGFSMNAKPILDSKKKFPLWNDLGLIFMNKLGMETENCLFQDPIKLASEVAANFGESVLNQILIDSIPDMDYEPSDLHIKFLKLNWTDVFTTNYDTLLERASEKINARHYSLVTKDYDLINAIKPRIVKLHGSFPSVIPFIITEEQYREYPKKHAVFVNTVQQALVENILVLIGFSGTDPNFLNWIGWIRDNLGTNLSNKIYFVTVDSLSNAKIKLFSERNINVVDLTVFKGSNKNDKSSLLTFFIDELIKKKSKDKLAWADNLSVHDIDASKNDLKKITKEFSDERESYPGWIILPKSQRIRLKEKTENFIKNIDKFENISDRENYINFLYEVNWRWGKCLLPLYNILQTMYEKALGLDIEQKKVNINLFNKTVQEHAIELILDLFRSYREDADKEKCTLLATILDSLKQQMTLSQQHRYSYEQILYASLLFDYEQFMEKIENWDIANSSPIWKIKKAGLLAEIGKKRESLVILDNMLKHIRKEQCRKDIVDEYYHFSIENLTMSLISYIQQSDSFSDKKTNYPFIDKSEFNDRKYISKRYNCDIFEELDSFIFHSNQLRKELEGDSFDIDTQTTYLENNSDVGKYSFIRFCEEIGYPYAIDHVNLEFSKMTYALKKIIKYQPEWCLSLLPRTYNVDSVKKVLDRNVVKLFNHEKTTRIISTLINAIYHFKNELSSPNGMYKNFANKIVKSLFEIISRFCTKSDSTTKKQICVLLKDCINNDIVPDYYDFQSFVSRFIKSLSNSEKIGFLPIFLDIKYPHSSNGYLWNPCVFLNFRADNRLKNSLPDNFNEIVNHIINTINTVQNADEKQWYIDALIVLYFVDVLSDNQKELLKDIIGNLPLDNNELPILKHFRKFAITVLPNPDFIDFKERYKNCMLKTDIQIITGNRSFTYSYPWYELTYGVDNAEYYTDEYCIRIVNQMKESWDKDSHILHKDLFDIFNEKKFIQETYLRCSIIIEKIILYRSEDLLNIEHKLNKILPIIKELLLNYLNNDIQCLPALITSSIIFPERKKEYLKLIENNIISNSKEKVADALNAIICIFSYEKIKLEKGQLEKIINLLADGILWQSRTALVDCLKTFTLFLRKNETYTFDKILFEKIICGLKNVRLSIYQSNFSLKEEIAIKAACAGLASSLLRYYKSKKLDIPNEIDEWKKICTNLDDFVEVRNSWVAETKTEDCAGHEN